MKTKALLFLLLLGVLAGCVGTPFRWDTARKIQVGMTKAQVTEIMGKPYVRAVAGEIETWTWSYGTGLGTGGAYKIALKDGIVTEVPKIPSDL
ncbi:MAG: outer membrane protein assembly factor BamE [Opitutaceae bacterium]|nr:outer membrane protein assembly factor BamE [Opitutaceae bacterium]